MVSLANFIISSHHKQIWYAISKHQEVTGKLHVAGELCDVKGKLGVTSLMSQSSFVMSQASLVSQANKQTFCVTDKLQVMKIRLHGGSR